MATLITLSLLSLLLSSSLLPLVSSLDCDAADKLTLLKFKSSFSGAAAFSSWLPTTNCCSWPGVQCEMSTGQLLGLTLSNSNLSGPIPSLIGDFPVLSYVDFHDLPHLTSPLPPSIANLTFLKRLTISKTSISGPIPHFLTSLPQLSDLDLSYNLLSGPIPDNLHYESINLAHNRLTGPIPDSLLLGSITQPSLHLSHNQLVGKIPPSFGKISFVEIDLSGNRLTGDAAFLFGAEKWARTVIDLSWNELEFDLTAVRFPEYYLRYLDLSHNRIRGRISQQIAKLKRLEVLNFSDNMLCGSIPSGTRLRKFNASSYANNKCLCGVPLPPCHGPVAAGI